MPACRFVTRVVAAVLLLSAASIHADTDQLSLARSRIRNAQCGAAPAVAAVAGVNPGVRQFYVGDWLLVSVCHLDKLLDAADAAQAPVTLLVEGLDTGNQPVGIDRDSGTLTFVLDRNEKNRDLWRPFLYAPLFDPEVSMRVSVGIRGERPLPRVPGSNLQITVRKLYVDWTTWLWLAFLLACVLVMLLVAARSDALRDAPALEGAKRPYSLGRAQMAWWFLLVVLSYSFIWLVTGDRDTIPPSVLGLIGISSATALAAALIAPRGDGPPARGSQGWWRDLVADDDGAVALDRLQIVVWTLVLSGIFLSSVLWELTMPEFNGTLLALMGVSSGTYIGFKLPQKG
ncbi:MAG: hypothetical protein QOJ98_2231 [Acidobacteriota bacterium]|jgi:hypothetical protein|nr:hypothetical protein [Acidobacteriota bacterium]